jgi:hypothetical protein
MTPLENTLQRPEFESLDLSIDADAAQTRIEDAIKGLSTATTEAGTKYRTTGGTLVAIVGPQPPDGGDAQSTVAYRTEPASDAATRKAAKIRDTLQPHAIDQ